jgi:asparagine synthase (glutamine-hydrolysing)
VAPAEPHRLTPLEVASGYLFGSEQQSGQIDDGRRQRTPLAALETVVREALGRPPCLVAFSGGRDSSAVLAVALGLARREGFPPPIPITVRFPEAAETDESSWQERVVNALRLDDWSRIDVTDELDCVGPVATRALQRHGLLWPPNAHFVVPLLEAASPGSLLTGNGGDQHFAASAPLSRPAAVLSGTVRPEPRDVLRVGLALSPRPLRRLVLARRHPDAVSAPWLREPARHSVRAAWAAEQASEPLRLGPRVRWSWGLRPSVVGRGSQDVLAEDAGTLLRHPLDTLEFLTALANEPRIRRLAGRTDVMRHLFGHLLPDDVCARRTKAGFSTVFWNRHSAEFADRWTGAGADPELVDVEAARSLWRSPAAREHFRSTTQLQAAWLADHARSFGDELEQAAAGGVERAQAVGSAQLPARQLREIQ